jgi:hypothetical protein
VLDTLLERPQAALERFRNRETSRLADFPERRFRFVIEPNGPSGHASPSRIT